MYSCAMTVLGITDAAANDICTQWHKIAFALRIVSTQPKSNLILYEILQTRSYNIHYDIAQFDECQSP